MKLAAWAAVAAAALAAAFYLLAGRDDRAALGAAADRAWAALVAAAPGGLEGGDEDDDGREGNDEDERGRGDDGREDDEDEDEDEDEAPLPLVDGVPAVRLDAERQELAGVETVRLEAARFVPTVLAAAEVVDIQPLAALRDAWRERFFDAEAADVAALAARREHERLAALYREDAGVAQKDVSRAEAARWIAQAERRRVRAGLDALRAQAAREWGPALAERAFADEDGAFAGLASGADSLLRAVLPVGGALPEGLREAQAERGGDSVPAAWVSPAPRDRAGAGESHFFLASALSLPAGLRLEMRIPMTVEPVTGAALPRSAAVRALGRDWVYARLDESHFVRREVSLDYVLPDGRYLAVGAEAGAEVVTAGALVLYAEEFRSQVRDEDDD